MSERAVNVHEGAEGAVVRGTPPPGPPREPEWPPPPTGRYEGYHLREDDVVVQFLITPVGEIPERTRPRFRTEIFKPYRLSRFPGVRFSHKRRGRHVTLDPEREPGGYLTLRLRGYHFPYFGGDDWQVRFQQVLSRKYERGDKITVHLPDLEPGDRFRQELDLPCFWIRLP